MRTSFLTIFTILALALPVFGQDGTLLDKEPFTFSPEFLSDNAKVKDGTTVFNENLGYLDDVRMFSITYISGGLRVKGYLACPAEPGTYPCIIYNRGGNREFGSLNESKMAFIIARAASWGYVVVASNYRGNGGGEGIEEFGGAEVDDILNLVPLLENLEMADATRIGMYGWSRGGMMTYLVLARTDRIKAAVIGGGLSDAISMITSRPEMEEVFQELVPDYANTREAALTARSAIRWPEKLCKTTPMLLLHGTADWRVIPEQALQMSQALLAVRHPFRLIMFEGGDHGLSEFRDEVDHETRAWFERYLAPDAQLPDLAPHGR